MRVSILLGMTLGLLLGANHASADDWTAVKLRGTVLQLVDNEWQPIERGAVIPDSRVIRTIGGSRVTLVRGAESIDLGANTQIQIYDEAARRPFTTVKQYFGRVEVEAEVRHVQHFAVQTPYLVAVVKGTRFTVMSGRTGSKVQVQRGAVSVEDNDDGSHAVVVAGQSAAVAKGDDLRVAGGGRLPDILDAAGSPFESNKGDTDGQGNDESGKGGGRGQSNKDDTGSSAHGNSGKDKDKDKDKDKG